MAKAKLTPKQLKFIREYVKTSNATEAAKKAGYSEKTACEQGSRLLANVKVASEVKKLQKKLEEEFSYSIYKSFKNFEKIQDLALEGDEKDLRAFLKAEELKGKLTGLYTEKHIHTGDIIVNHMGSVKVDGVSFDLKIGEDPNANIGDGTT